MEWDCGAPWYHGPPLKLEFVRRGSTIAQDRELARVFSHKHTIVFISDDGKIKRDGKVAGFL
ncbi:MAG: hypothetical protein JTT11_01020 [Candidatus Brockarchaeota archaeon]|nr:hypothetical protein [Candidatus Brockarchaeota archaeon]